MEATKQKKGVAYHHYREERSTSGQLLRVKITQSGKCKVAANSASVGLALADIELLAEMLLEAAPVLAAVQAQKQARE